MEEAEVTLSPHPGSKGWTVRQPVADPQALVQTRSGHVNIGAIEFQMSYDGDEVGIEFISRKRGVQLNAGCMRIAPDEMDSLCRAWLNQRHSAWKVTNETPVQDSAEQAVKDCQLSNFDYEDWKFRKFFTTPFEQYASRVGETFTVLGEDKEASKELDNPEVMYSIKFDDGTVITAWGHEVCVLNYKECK